ncbi:lymphocyte antigen 6E-like [Dendropsophus ebraccatus]|uniref:lymphocyte antigen 6E-like n=1 Tax=Dendropsophus ebraccatus TaxID=150705 RepID=UPI0038312C04
MAAYTSLLLVIALCATTGYSLQCYTCELEYSNDKCLTATQCDSNATSCLTTVGTSGGGSSISVIIKSCEVYCTPLKIEIAGATATTYCCRTDLCNKSGGVSVTSSYTAIILALGAVLTVLKSSVL